MKFVIFACLLAISFAHPTPEKDAAIIRDDRINEGEGSYSFDFETENGIIRSEGGQPEGESGAVASSGNFQFELPDGQLYTLKFVANERGYQPESPFLPVAPAFPHEIPAFVLDQIAFAEQQKTGSA